MAHLHPRPEDLPDTFPVFPLTGALLLPGGRLPLNIFEARYLALTDDALGARRLFGMIQPNSQAPAVATGPALYRIGCLGRLSSFSETEDGRYLITLTGVIRFTVVEELAPKHGYRRVRADLARFAADLDLEAPPAAYDRPALLASLRAYFAHRGIEANWEAIDGMADDALVTTLCMACPFEPAEKQALLEAATPADRTAALAALLQIDTHATPAGTAPPRSRAS
jgi:Lon protease-like protein